MVSHRRRKNRHANKLARRLVTKVREAESELPEYVASPAAATAPISQQQPSPFASQKEEKDNARHNNQSEASSPSSLSESDPPASTTTAPTITTSPTPINIWSTPQKTQPSPEQQQAAAALQFLASSSLMDREASTLNPKNPFFGASCAEFSNDSSLQTTIDNIDDNKDTAVSNENDPADNADDNTDAEDHQSARLLQQLCWWRDLTPHEKERIAQASPTSCEHETVAKFVREAKAKAKQQKEVAIGAIQQKYRSSLMNLGKNNNDNDAVPVLSVQVPSEEEEKKEEEKKQQSPVKETAPSQQQENVVGSGHPLSPAAPIIIPFQKPNSSSPRKPLHSAKTTNTSSSNTKTATPNRSIRDTILTPTTRTNIQKVPRPSQQLQGVDMKGIYKSAFQARWMELRAQRIRRSEAAREIQQWWITRKNNGKKNLIQHSNDDDDKSEEEEEEEEEDNDGEDRSMVESADQSIGGSSSSDSQSEGSDSSSDDEEEDEQVEQKSISWGCLLFVMTIVIGMIAFAIVLAADADGAKTLMVELSKISSRNLLDEVTASAPASDDCEAQGVCEPVFG